MDIDYKLIFSATPSLFMLLKPNPPVFTILDSNAAHLAATMTKTDEIVNRSLFDVFPDNPSDLDANGSSTLRKSLERVIAEKKQDSLPTIKYDVPVETENGTVFEERYWTVKNTPVFDEKNEVVYIINQAEDVTVTVKAQKTAEAEIKQKSLQLSENKDRIESIMDALLRYTVMDFSERLVISEKRDELDAIAFGLNSLVDELENQISLMKKFNDELEEANNELDSFSYSVSHDLRAPLRAVSGYSLILLEDYGSQLDEEGRETIGTIVKNAQKMGMLIDDLLEFSHTGKQSLSKVTLNMNSLVETVIYEQTNGKNNRAEFIVKPLSDVKGDNSMIRQLLTNLISNALKYSDKREKIVIEIGCYDEDNTVVYYVKDNGAGFDMKYYNKLFGVFQRLHSSSEFEGTGVGLALVQRIVKKHDGHVWAKSVLGEGATFFFSLPAITS